MSEATELQRRMFEAVRAYDLAALRSLYHADHVYRGPDGVVQAGADAGVAAVESYRGGFPDWDFDLLSTYECGDVAVSEVRTRGTHLRDLADLPATGNRFELLACNVIEARDGRIYRERDYYDSLLLMRQLGAVPGAH